jgi:hypothetical protein
MYVSHVLGPIKCGRAQCPPPIAADGGRGFTARQGFGPDAVRPDDLGELLLLER